MTITELMILHALSQPPASHSPSGVADFLRTGEKYAVAPSVLYPALGRLAQAQLVESALGEPSRRRGGRAVRTFWLTDKGLRALADFKAMARRIAGS